MRDEYKAALFKWVENSILDVWKGAKLRSKDRAKNALTFWKHCSDPDLWMFVKVRVDSLAESFSCEIGWNSIQKIEAPDFMDSRSLDFDGSAYELGHHAFGLKLLTEGNDGCWYLFTLEEQSQIEYIMGLSGDVTDAQVQERLMPHVSDFLTQLESNGLPYLEWVCSKKLGS
ncbi:hypothetical protein [Rubritalea squalenifaciens]|nr:hypothetical protein [Rubritalea squalenifaciens]